ncbi:hypothetical protein J437_LFUL016416 [Ladona fulva]|uniref:Uncharacterized protein n=1 Tax=Ladona fulva TaxID=123851 RepID=A0A8K0PB86_LADFU|nr:hypothetical protein J437_LFUL016416 [Ladona fulva]
MHATESCLQNSCHTKKTRIYKTIICPGADIISEIKSRRIRWAGHILRKEEGCVLKDVLKRNPEGRPPRGRPRQKSWNQVKTNLEKR